MLELSENFAQIPRPYRQRCLFGSHRLNALAVVAEQFSRPHGFLAGVGLAAMPTVLLVFDFFVSWLILSPTICRHATALRDLCSPYHQLYSLETATTGEA
jgi:hypothetical protein